MCACAKLSRTRAFLLHKLLKDYHLLCDTCVTSCRMCRIVEFAGRPRNRTDNMLNPVRFDDVFPCVCVLWNAQQIPGVWRHLLTSQSNAGFHIVQFWCCSGWIYEIHCPIVRLLIKNRIHRTHANSHTYTHTHTHKATHSLKTNTLSTAAVATKNHTQLCDTTYHRLTS